MNAMQVERLRISDLKSKAVSVSLTPSQPSSTLQSARVTESDSRATSNLPATATSTSTLTQQASLATALVSSTISSSSAAKLPINILQPVIAASTNHNNNDISLHLAMITSSIPSTADATKRREGLAQTRSRTSTPSVITTITTTTTTTTTLQSQMAATTSATTSTQQNILKQPKQLSLQIYQRNHECVILAQQQIFSNQVGDIDLVQNSSSSLSSSESKQETHLIQQQQSQHPTFAQIPSIETTTTTTVRSSCRCMHCNSTMKYIYHSGGGGVTLDAPFEIYYADFKEIYSRKMECHILPASLMKEFISFQFLPHLRESVFFMLDRPQFLGLEDCVFNTAAVIPSPIASLPVLNDDPSRIPIPKEQIHLQRQLTSIPSEISRYFPMQMSDGSFDFGAFTILGNFEGANIAFCTMNPETMKFQILLRGDTNTQGCLHWFMFTIRVRHSMTARSNAGNIRSRLPSQESDDSCSNDGDDDNRSQDELSDEKQNKNQLEPKPITLQFSILNNKRHGQLYKEGMQIAVLDSQKPSKGWHRGGDNLFYYKSNVNHQYFRQTATSNGIDSAISNGMFPNPSSQTNQQSQQQQQQQSKEKEKEKKSRLGFQTLDFSYTFSPSLFRDESTPIPDQRVTFAYCYPYSLTELIAFLEKIEAELISSGPIERQSLDENKRTLLIQTPKISYRKKTIGCSRLGLPIIQLRITSTKKLRVKQRKRDIFVIARQHPGETPSSYVCEGLIKFLLSDSQGSQYLLDHFVFKIVPMMNPDGVVVGNSRCNISGTDLNRKWDTPDVVLHPEVFEVKSRLKRAQAKRGVFLFCDLHGHSMKKHSFFYGCNKANEQNGGMPSWAMSRLLPRILARKNPHFALDECRFRVTDDKKNTARVIAWDELKILNSFTLETSFFGYEDKSNENKATHFTPNDLKKIGNDLCQSMIDFYIMAHTLRKEVRDCDGNLKSTRYEGASKSSSKQAALSTNIPVLGFSSQQIVPGSINLKPAATINGTPAAAATATTAVPTQSLSRNPPDQNLNKSRSATPQNSRTTPKPQQGKGTSMAEDQLLINQYGNSNNNNSVPPVQKQQNQLQQQRDSESEESEQEALASIHKCTNVLKRKHWRDYFKKDELEKNFKRILRGDDPNDAESVSGSDSDAEGDIFKGSDLMAAHLAASKSAKKKSSSSSHKNQQNKRLKKYYRSETLEMKSTASTNITSATPNTSIPPTAATITQQPPLSSTTTYSGTASPFPLGKSQQQKWQQPSPLIQSYKLQMEIKRQNLKKQSYPIAKVGQNFAMTNGVPAAAAATNPIVQSGTASPAPQGYPSIYDNKQCSSSSASGGAYEVIKEGRNILSNEQRDQRSVSMFAGGSQQYQQQQLYLYQHQQNQQNQNYNILNAAASSYQQQLQQQQQHSSNQSSQQMAKNSVNSFYLSQRLSELATTSQRKKQPHQQLQSLNQQQLQLQKQQPQQQQQHLQKQSQQQQQQPSQSSSNPAIFSPNISYYRKRMEKLSGRPFTLLTIQDTYQTTATANSVQTLNTELNEQYSHLLPQQFSKKQQLLLAMINHDNVGTYAPIGESIENRDGYNHGESDNDETDSNEGYGFNNNNYKNHDYIIPANKAHDHHQFSTPYKQTSKQFHPNSDEKDNYQSKRSPVLPKSEQSRVQQNSSNAKRNTNQIPSSSNQLPLPVYTATVSGGLVIPLPIRGVLSNYTSIEQPHSSGRKHEQQHQQQTQQIIYNTNNQQQQHDEGQILLVTHPDRTDFSPVKPISRVPSSLSTTKKSQSCNSRTNITNSRQVLLPAPSQTQQQQSIATGTNNWCQDFKDSSQLTERKGAASSNLNMPQERKSSKKGRENFDQSHQNSPQPHDVNMRNGLTGLANSELLQRTTQYQQMEKRGDSSRVGNSALADSQRLQTRKTTSGMVNVILHERKSPLTIPPISQQQRMSSNPISQEEFNNVTVVAGNINSINSKKNILESNNNAPQQQQLSFSSNDAGINSNFNSTSTPLEIESKTHKKKDRAKSSYLDGAKGGGPIGMGTAPMNGNPQISNTTTIAGVAATIQYLTRTPNSVDEARGTTIPAALSYLADSTSRKLPSVLTKSVLNQTNSNQSQPNNNIRIRRVPPS